MTDAYPAPLDDAELAATWGAAWSSLSVQAPGGLQSELMAAWDEPHRQYHDQRHLRECLALWMRWRGHCERSGEVAVAIWFHDAIYDPRDGSNELNSADWAARSLIRAGADSDTAQRVHDLVMATHLDVRKEYAWVPEFRYQEARAQVLQSFLDRPRLYHGEATVALLQSQARINLADALTSTFTRLAQ